MDNTNLSTRNHLALTSYSPDPHIQNSNIFILSRIVFKLNNTKRDAMNLLQDKRI